MTGTGAGPTDGGDPTEAGTGDAADADSGPGRSGPPSVGPLAVEAALLLDVMADRLTSMRPADADPDPDAGRSAPDPAPDPAPGQRTAPPPGAPQASTRSEPRLGPDGRCPECGSIPGASCTACPLCRFLAVLRGERPEATAKLVDGALLIVRTLRSLLPDGDAAGATTAAGATSAGSGDHRPASPPASPVRRPGGLEHIDIR